MTPTEYHFVDPLTIGWRRKLPGVWYDTNGKPCDLPVNSPVIHVPVGYPENF